MPALKAALVAVTVVFFPSAVRGHQPPAATRPLIANLVVNQRLVGEVVLVDAPDGPWLDRDALQKLHVSWPDALERVIDDIVFVDVARVSGVTVRWLPDRETLELDVDAAALPATRIDLAGARHPSATALSSVVANYAVTGRAGAMAVSTDLAARWRGVLVQSTAVLQSNSGADGGRRFTRGLTSLTVDDQRRLVRWRAGEFYQRGGAGTVMRVIGGEVSRALDIEPSNLPHAPLAFSGAVDTPSTADVYVDGQLVARTELPAGAFDLRDIPATAGAGELRVVLRDAFGRQQDLAQAFYRSPTVLRRGLHLFSHGVGVVPRAAGRPPQLAARVDHRLGVTNDLTAGLALTGLGGEWRGGPSLALQSRAGLVEVGAIGMASDGGVRAGGSVAYEYRGRTTSFRASARPAEVDAVTAASRYDLTAGASMLVRRGLSMQGTWLRGHARLLGAHDRATLTVMVSPSPRWHVQLFVSQSRRGSAARVGSLGLSCSRFFGDRTTARLSWQAPSRGQAPIVASVQRSTPLGPGHGYSVDWNLAESTPNRATLSAHHVALRSDLTYTRLGGAEAWDATASGALVLTEGTLRVARPIHDAWAIVDVPGRRGVRAASNRQPVGVTGRSGSVLVPSLTSYADANLSVDDDDLPIGAATTATTMTVRPGLRGGVRVRFLDAATGAVTARVDLPAHLRGGGVVARLRQTSGQLLAASPIGIDGTVYFELNAPVAGALLITIDTTSITCRLTAAPPADGSALIDAGTLTCLDVPQARGTTR